MICLAVVGWAFNLSSRVSVQEQRHEDLLELISTRFDAVNDRLERIEDAMNGAFRHHDHARKASKTD